VGFLVAIKLFGFECQISCRASNDCAQIKATQKQLCSKIVVLKSPLCFIMGFEQGDHQMINITRENGQTLAKVADLKKWKDNPRDVSKADFQRLKRQLELGEHSPILITSNGIVLGGNTRLRAYQEAGKEFAKVIVVEFKKGKDGYEAYVDGIKAPRTFQSEEAAMLEYALSHNDMVGAYNEGKLAELLQVHSLPMEVYKVTSVVRPVEDVAFEHAGDADPANRPQDEDTTDTDKLETFMNGAIKQIVLYFDNEQYENVIPRIEALREKFEVDNNTDLFLAMLARCEDAD
jgi:hypothetical protein